MEANSAPTNPLAGFEEPLRGGREGRKKEEKKNKEGTQGTGENAPEIIFWLRPPVTAACDEANHQQRNEIAVSTSTM